MGGGSIGKESVGVWRPSRAREPCPSPASTPRVTARAVDARAEGPRRLGGLLVPLGLGVAIAGGLYVFGTQHTPDYSGTALFGRTAADTLPLKSWLASGLLGLAVLQVVLALWMFGMVPRVRPAGRPVRNLHRGIGVAVIALSVPIAYHCAFAYGVQTHLDARVAIHSLAGCFLYGAVAAKLLVVRSRRLPGWALPLAGGLVVVTVAALWYTSALWYFNDYALPAI
jgi:hypothetical protein